MMRATLLAATLLTACGCAYLDPHNMIGRQLGNLTPATDEFSPRTRASLTTAQREEA